MNPFGAEFGQSSPSGPSGPSGRGPVLNVETPLLKGETKGVLGFETRRSELYPEVRDYADKMHARLLDIYKKYGATDAEGMRNNILAGRGPKLGKKDVEEIEKLLDALDFTLSNNELPHGQRELPPLEVLQKTLEKINDDVSFLNAYVVGLDPWDEYELIDGKLNGRFKVHLSDLQQDRWFPVINGEIVESIDGFVVLDGADVRNKGGRMNGRVNIGERWLPVIDGELIKSINGQEIKNCLEIRNVGGGLNGEVDLGAGCWLPVIDGELIKSINGQEIKNCSDVRNIGGKLNGTVGIGRLILPVIAGELVESIGGEEIVRCSCVRNVEGKLNGAVRVNGGYFPVIDGQLIKEIGGMRIVNCSEIRNVDGKLNGRVLVETGSLLPVIDGELVEEIDGKKVLNCYDVRNVDGKLNGTVGIGRLILPVIAGELVEDIDGIEIFKTEGAPFSNAGGKFSGRVHVKMPNGDEKRRLVVLGKFVW